jgi:chaperonin cofactor prefoldin
MGLYDFWWNSVQAEQISDLEDEIKTLKEQTTILKEWVDYLNTELIKLKQDKQNDTL